MPTYTYTCKDCGERVDVVRSFTDGPLAECPTCGSDALRQVFKPAGIVFKGSGWHIKDYAKSGTSGNGSSTSGASGEARDAGSSRGGSASSDSSTASDRAGGSTAASPSSSPTSSKGAGSPGGKDD